MAVHLRGRSLLTLMDLTPEEIRYLLDLAHDLKSKKRLGITNQSRNRQRHIQPLLDMGILEMTNPENPTAHNQKYRRVSKK